MVRLSARQYLAIRLLLWAIAVFIAMLPSIMGNDSFSDFMQADSFRELLFVVVPVSALALSTTFDYLCIGFPKLSARAFFFSLGSILLNGIGLTTGLAGFLNVRSGVLSHSQLWTYSVLICVAVASSLLTEVLVSLNNHTLAVALTEHGA